MRSLLLPLFMLLGLQAFAQVTIDVNSLPEVGDALQYRAFTNYEGDTTYRDAGENMSWSFDDFEIVGDTQVEYPAVSGGLDTIFPGATITLQLAGFAAAAARTDSTIEVIGVAGGQLQGFNFNPQRFPDPYVEVLRPMNFGDNYSSSLDLPFALPASAIGLDSLGLPVAVDSVRVVTNLQKTESAEAWGSLSVWGSDFDVLKVKKEETFQLSFELQVPFLGWLDIVDLLAIFGGGGGDMGIDSLLGPGFGEPMTTVSYTFYTPDQKESVLEFQESEFTPPMGGETVMMTSGTISADITSAVDDYNSSIALTLSPNPSSDIIRFVTEEVEAFKSLQVIDNQGKVVYSKQNFDHRQGLDVSSYAAGTYMLVVGTEQGYTTQRVVVASRR